MRPSGTFSPVGTSGRHRLTAGGQARFLARSNETPYIFLLDSAPRVLYSWTSQSEYPGESHHLPFLSDCAAILFRDRTNISMS